MPSSSFEIILKYCLGVWINFATYKLPHNCSFSRPALVKRRVKNPALGIWGPVVLFGILFAAFHRWGRTLTFTTPLKLWSHGPRAHWQKINNAHCSPFMATGLHDKVKWKCGSFSPCWYTAIWKGTGLRDVITSTSAWLSCWLEDWPDLGSSTLCLLKWMHITRPHFRIVCRQTSIQKGCFLFLFFFL